jgi:hypothetical protein
MMHCIALHLLRLMAMVSGEPMSRHRTSHHETMAWYHVSIYNARMRPLGLMAWCGAGWAVPWWSSCRVARDSAVV